MKEMKRMNITQENILEWTKTGFLVSLFFGIFTWVLNTAIIQVFGKTILTILPTAFKLLQAGNTSGLASLGSMVLVAVLVYLLFGWFVEGYIISFLAEKGWIKI